MDEPQDARQESIAVIEKELGRQIDALNELQSRTLFTSARPLAALRATA